MAVNYTNLFEDVGEFLERITKFRTYTDTDLPAELGEIQTELSGNGRYDVLSNVPQLFDGFKDTILSWIDSMVNKITERLTHRDTILTQLQLTQSNSDIQAVLRELIFDMLDNSQTVNTSTATNGAFSYASGNVGNGKVVLCTVLDGVTNPGSGFQAHPRYRGLTSQLGCTETVYLECVGDSEVDGLTEGQELFQIIGDPAYSSPYDWRGEGSGPGPTFSAAAVTSLMSNGDLETWSNGGTAVPDNWVVDTGTFNTNILRESTTKYRGTYGLKFIGNGTNDRILEQDVSTTLKPGKSYIIGFQFYGHASHSTGTFRLRLMGTGIGATDFNLTPSSLTTASWAFYSTIWTLPWTLPSDLVLQIACLAADQTYYVDDVFIIEPVWHDGLGYAVFPGSTPWLRNDRISHTKAAGSGVFQNFFRKVYRVQLPSSGTPSIADSLATD